jgi:PAS domain S-box-containing protein
MNSRTTWVLPNRSRIDRTIKLTGTLLLGVLALVPPALYIVFAANGMSRAMEAETHFLARQVERIIHDRPDLWEYETLRLAEITGQSSFDGDPTSRDILDMKGSQLAGNGVVTPAPRLHLAVPIFDSGREAARLVADRSLRPLLFRGLLLGIVSQLLAVVAMFLLRAMPMRFIDGLLEELNDERRKSEAILQAIQEGVIAVDSQDRIIRLNPVAESLLGVTNVQAAGVALGTVYKTSRVAHQGLVSERTVLHCPDGRRCTLEEREFPIPLPGTAEPGRVILFRDITEEVQSETEVLRARQIDSLGVLAGGIAHDFNNFLGAIMGNVSLAKEMLGAESDITERLGTAISAAERARQISNRLLAFAKGGEPSRVVLDPRALAKEAAAFVLQGSGVLCSFNFPPGLWCVEGDAGLLSQVINNVVINAKQAMGDHGNLRIQGENAEIAARQIPYVAEGRFVILHVEDSGPGIPESIRHRIFEPYFTTKESGSGLGLASAYKIMKAHGGNIFVESSSLGGAHFLLYLPASDRRPQEAPPEPARVASTQGGRILVMDDDPIILDTCRQILEHYGFKVTTSPEGRRASAAYAKAMDSGTPFDVVILDLTVPGGLGGRETAKLILDRDPKALIIASSGYSDDPIMARPTDFGFKTAIPKPYSAPELLRCVQGQLEEVKKG